MSCRPVSKVTTPATSRRRPFRAALLLATLLATLAGCGTLVPDSPSPPTPSAASSPDQLETGPPPAARQPYLPAPPNPVVEYAAVLAPRFTDGADGLLPSFAGLAVDGTGKIYVTDQTLSQIFQIDRGGQVEVFAGNGNRANSGDDGPALAAGLRDPGPIVAHSRLGVYFASRTQIRHVDTDGHLTLVAGQLEPGRRDDPQGIGVAAFDGISGLALDGEGNLYVADRGNNLVRRVSADGSVTTYAGDGLADTAGDGETARSASFDAPADLAIAADGSIFVSERDGHVIRRISPEGKVSTLAGTGIPGRDGDGGPARGAQLNSPRSIDVDSEGNVYVVDWNNAAIRVIDGAGTIRTYAGLGTAGPAMAGAPAREAALARPVDFQLGPDGTIHLIGQLTGRVDRLSGFSGPASDAVCPVAPAPVRHQSGIGDSGIGAVEWFGRTGFGFAGDGGPIGEAQFAGPDSIGYSRAGLVLADTGNNRIRLVSGATIETLAGTGAAALRGDGGLASFAVLSSPKAILADATGSVYFFDAGNFYIRQIDPCGVITSIAGNGRPGDPGDGGPALSTSLSDVVALAMDEQGGIYLADSAADRVLRLTPDGTLTPFAGNGQEAAAPIGASAVGSPLHNPYGLAVGPSGKVFISENGTARILAVDPSSGLIELISEDHPDAGSLAVDASGAIYVAGESVGRLDKISQTGRFSLVSPDEDDSVAVNEAVRAPRALVLVGESLLILDASGVVWVMA